MIKFFINTLAFFDRASPGIRTNAEKILAVIDLAVIDQEKTCQF
jgi:hypothetical protein